MNINYDREFSFNAFRSVDIQDLPLAASPVNNIIITLYIMSMCRVKISQTMLVLVNILNLIFYLGVLSIGYSDIFYKSATFTIENGVGMLHKE